MLRFLSAHVLSTASKIMILDIKFWLLVLEFSALENENRQLQTSQVHSNNELSIIWAGQDHWY